MDFNQNNRGFGFNGNGQNTYFQQQQPVYQRPSPQQSYNQFALNGRVIQTINEVVPNDVKMDGSVSFFPVMNGSEIYAMRWSQDGSRIEHVRYVPENVPADQNAKSSEQMIPLILERLEALETLIRSQKAYNNHNGFKNKNNKEVIRNESDSTNGDEPTGTKQP